MKKEYEDVLEYLGWDWQDYGNEYCLAKFTPIANSYLYFYFPKDNFIESIKDYGEKLDPEEYVDECMEGVLYDNEEEMNSEYELYLMDGEEMKELFMELAEELEEAEIESEVA